MPWLCQNLSISARLSQKFVLLTLPMFCPGLCWCTRSDPAPWEREASHLFKGGGAHTSFFLLRPPGRTLHCDPTLRESPRQYLSFTLYHPILSNSSRCEDSFHSEPNLSWLSASVIILPFRVSPLDNDSLIQINFYKYLNLQKL